MRPVVEAHRLTKYYGLHRGVENLEFSIQPGEVFGFLGPNGSGKTTTIRLMLNFVRPTRGRMLVFGKRPAKGGPGLRRRIGHLPSELGLYEEFTGLHSLNLYRDLGGGAAPLRGWLCGMLELGAGDLKRRVKGYSKGMKQKLGIVQALQHDPDLVILDEPTGGLDPLVQRQFYEVLRELKRRGKTVFFSSHILSEVREVCDRVGVLMDGRLILSAPVPDLLASAERLLWVRLCHPDLLEDPPRLDSARFLRRDGDWLVYLAASGESGRLLSELALLNPVDFRFESAMEELFVSLYRRGREGQ
jgi:ABC-2 type transport system ATP-binding protein